MGKFCDFGVQYTHVSGIGKAWILNLWMPHLGSYHDQEPLSSGQSIPVGPDEAQMEVGGKLNNATFCNPSFCVPLNSFILLLPHPPSPYSISPLHPTPALSPARKE